MPMIRECIVTTINAEGEVHIAPLGLIADGEGWFAWLREALPEGEALLVFQAVGQQARQ